MESIDLQHFSSAIRRQYPGLTQKMADGYARLWVQKMEPQLIPALLCWINQEPLPAVEHHGMTLKKVLAICGDGDELQAMLLLSEYIRDPKVGMARILAPRRG